MALAQHSDLTVRFRQQVDNAKKYLFPFIEPHLPIGQKTKVLEIGSAEGGVLVPFLEAGAWCLGVDLSESRIKSARQQMAETIKAGKADFQARNVYDPDFVTEFSQAFDLIILKDTIEHIPHQETFIPHLRNLVKPGGLVFFGFPPWRMPFGGHQQICRSPLLGKLPWYHLLPKRIYKSLLTSAGEPSGVIKELMDIKSTGISTARFERILNENDLPIVAEQQFLFNPIYEFKFGVKPRPQAKIISAIPHLRDFLTTAAWYLVKFDAAEGPR